MRKFSPTMYMYMDYPIYNLSLHIKIKMYIILSFLLFVLLEADFKITALFLYNVITLDNIYTHVI